jgi:nitroreductase
MSNTDKKRRSIRGYLGPFTPQWIKTTFNILYSRWRLINNCIYDYRFYKRWSGLPRLSPSRINLRALITMDYHRIEKGLSLREPRPGFGKYHVEKLVRNLHSYVSRYEADSTVVVAVNVLRAYREFNQRHDSVDQRIHDEIGNLEQRVEKSPVCDDRGGCIELTREQIHQAGLTDLHGFFTSRHSVRDFSDEPVSRQLVERAIAMAQWTPSVCNRQAWRVYCFHDPDTKRAVLSHQNGNMGFGHQASWVFVITCDVAHFVSVGERNQAWVDGGMFAMSLLYAFHSLGLGACALNWSKEKEADRALRKTAGIDDRDVIIMLMAVGHLPERLRVAHSARKDLNEVMIVAAD